MNSEFSLFNIRQQKPLVGGCRPRLTNSTFIQVQIQLFESVHPNIYELLVIMERPVLPSLTRPDPRLAGQPLAQSCFGCCLSCMEAESIEWCCFLQAKNTKVNSSKLQGGWHQGAEVCSSVELLGTCLQLPWLATRSPWLWTTVEYPK